MFHFTMFGGSEAQITTANMTAITIFGGADLKRPTLAQRVLQLAASEDPESESSIRRPGPRSFAFTMFGGTDVKHPLLMEEYSAIHGLVATQLLRREEIQSMIAEILAQDAHYKVGSFTLFGGFSDKRPNRKAQFRALREGEEAGLISVAHCEELERMVDAGPAVAFGLLGRLVDEMDLPPEVSKAAST